MTAPEHTPLDDLRDAVEDLQRERVESRDHRTRVQTLLTLAGAAALLVVAGAVSVRDTVLRQESATTALTARVVALEAASGRRDTHDRATSAATVDGIGGRESGAGTAASRARGRAGRAAP